MLEYDFDDSWTKALHHVNPSDIINVTRPYVFEETFDTLLDVMWRVDKVKFYSFLKVSLIGFIENVRDTKDYAKVLKYLENLDFPQNDLQELQDSINKRKGQLDSTNRKHLVNKQNTIFIGHGRSLVWHEVEKYLKSENLECESFESQSRVSEHILDILNKMLDNAKFAIIVVTAEDETKEGKIRPRQNVVHEIGLFQGRLGFNNVVILKQEGTEEFTNIAGLQYISFSGNKIQQSFYELREYLKKAGLVNNALR